MADGTRPQRSHDELWVYANDKGELWDINKHRWVSVLSELFTAWLDHELYKFEQTKAYSSLPKKGRWVDLHGSRKTK